MLSSSCQFSGMLVAARELPARAGVHVDMSTAPEAGVRDLPLFFAIVFGSTWLLQLPAILVQHGLIPGPLGPYMPLESTPPKVKG